MHRLRCGPLWAKFSADKLRPMHFLQQRTILYRRFINLHQLRDWQVPTFVRRVELQHMRGRQVSARHRADQLRTVYRMSSRKISIRDRKLELHRLQHGHVPHNHGELDPMHRLCCWAASTFDGIIKLHCLPIWTVRSNARFSGLYCLQRRKIPQRHWAHRLESMY